MDFYSSSDEQIENDEERNYPSREEVRKEREENKKRLKGKEKKQTVDEDETGEYLPTRRKPKSSKKKLNIEIPRVSIIIKLIAVVAVCFNIRFLLNFMKVPFSTFDHTLFVAGICVAINFIAIWLLFHKRSFIRLYLSLFAILVSFGYYFYVNYTYMSFLGNNLITSVLVGITLLIAINPKFNYYMKSFVFLLVPIIGIYLSSNKFALVWTLMFNAGLILLFRVSKSTKKEARTKTDQKQTA